MSRAKTPQQQIQEITDRLCMKNAHGCLTREALCKALQDYNTVFINSYDTIDDLGHTREALQFSMVFKTFTEQLRSGDAFSGVPKE